MPYKYYQEIESCAHFLYASEIAEITQLYTYKGEPHKRFVTAYYDHRFCEHKLYYNSRAGLIRVLPKLEQKSELDLLVNTVRQSPKGKNGEYLVSIENNRIYHVFFGTSLI